jgi:putative molybdopterin biosynthesis protein
MDPATGIYNRPFLTDALILLPGYQRLQGVIFRPEDRHFASRETAESAVAAALADTSCLMVNRNAGSGTRNLIDRILGGVRPPGHAYQAKSHNGVAIAVAQRRADWGVAIETVARQYGLGFIPLQAEQYDFVIPRARMERPAVRRFIALLQDPGIRKRLDDMGFRAPAEAA